MRYGRQAIAIVFATIVAAAPAADSRNLKIEIIDPPEKDFFSKRLDFHGIPIKAHAVVADEALFAAYDRLALMFTNLLRKQPMVLSNLVAAGAALHIIGRDQVTTDLPEWRHDKGKPIAEYNGRTRDERTRGMGGLLTSCGEENLLKLPSDRYRGRDICLHEFSHNVLDNGCPREIERRFDEQRKRSLEKGLWQKSYAGSNADEFFAELTMWYFGTRGDLSMTGPKPADGPEGLKAYDQEAFALMDDFYSGRIEISKVEPRRRGRRAREEEISADPSSDATSLERHGKRDVRVHDPSTIVKCKNEYWFFATGPGVSSWRSKDLVRWERGPRVFTDLPPWITNVVAGHRGYFWAPDVIEHAGHYWVYYSVSKFGQNTSAIGFASNPTLDPNDPVYRWTDHGIVMESKRTNDFNAIDPALIKTPRGEIWLSFGSFWSGIKLMQLDPATGGRVASNPRMHSIAFTNAIEAPFIYQHDNFHYLFVNWDRCCRATNSTYNIRIGRSRDITGPYLDKDGKDLAHGGGTLLLGTDGAFIGPGHAGIFQEEKRFWFSAHFYDGTDRGVSKLAIRPLDWGADGWPVLRPINPETSSSP